MVYNLLTIELSELVYILLLIFVFVNGLVMFYEGKHINKGTRYLGLFIAIFSLAMILLRLYNMYKY
ncbi:hypothetical protein RJG79_08475 [Mycoplasmatota bacterium WC44]